MPVDGPDWLPVDGPDWPASGWPRLARGENCPGTDPNCPDRKNVEAGSNQEQLPMGSTRMQFPDTSKRNVAGTVNGREYSGHAFDQMQNRGITPTVVDHTIQTGTATAGKVPGTMAHYDSVNNITVITNSESGRVVTVSYGQIKQ